MTAHISGRTAMMIRQGDIYWLDLGSPKGSEPGFRHPHVVIQNDVFNASRINTVVVCALTTNLRRAQAPGNVILNKGEANLPKRVWPTSPRSSRSTNRT